MIVDLWQDLRYGARMLLKQPAFTLIAVLTLALGIGANTAIFSVIKGVLLNPFPFAEPERLVVIWERCLPQGIPRMVVSPPNFADLRAQSRSFADVAAYRQQDFNLTGEGEAELARGLRVSATMFSLLGVKPALGRVFQPDEDQPGAPAAVIISHGFWQRRYGGEPGALGRRLTLGNESATIIGVMPPGFDFPPPISFRGEARQVTVELWTQLRYAQELNQRGAHNLFVLARLKPGVTSAAAEAELQSLSRRLSADYPQTNAGWDAFLVPLHEQVVGDVRAALLILPAAVACVLLIACANVANLLLARASGRRRELAVRAALGAGRGRLTGQLLVESLLLALFGGALGLALAAGALRLIAALAPPNIYRLDAVSLDGGVAVFTLLLSLLTALLFGLLPAWQASRPNLAVALKDGSAGAGSRSRLRNLLVVAEVALALTLLAGAGLLVRSFIRLQSLPTGFQAEQLTAVKFNLPRAAYPDAQARLNFTERLLPRVAALPGLQSVAFSDNLPFDTGKQGTSFKVEGAPASQEREPHTNVSIVSPGYFHTMGVQLLQGREFTAADRADAPGVIIINRELARRFFPGQDALGKRVDMGFRQGTPLEIVGVVDDERHESLQAPLYPGMYLPYAQVSTTRPLILLLRSASDPAALTRAVRAQVRELDAQLPVYDIRTGRQVLAAAAARPQFMTALLTAFAVVAALLATVGIYGVMSYMVAQSTRELGIRLALGAQVGDVLRLVIGQGLLLAGAGIGAGLLGALAGAQSLRNLLFEVSATDPLTFAGAALLLLLVALLACWIPARRATKVDPMIALRCE